MWLFTITAIKRLDNGTISESFVVEESQVKEKINEYMENGFQEIGVVLNKVEKVSGNNV